MMSVLTANCNEYQQHNPTGGAVMALDVISVKTLSIKNIKKKYKKP